MFISSGLLYLLLLALGSGQVVTLVGMRDEFESSGQPFKSLGLKLKTVREQAKQSLAEVSGAVEIDINEMQRIEKGEARPSEEILLLLISYFDLIDEEATGLWELAGYTSGESKDAAIDPETLKAFASILAPDLRIIYSDMVHMSSNSQGLTMNFLQSGGVNGQPMIVSRLGMSREQAENVLKMLAQTLAISSRPTNKALPAPKRQSNKKSKSAN